MKSDKLTAVLAAGLFLSLSVNFFFAGRMLGDAVHADPMPSAAAPDTRAERDSRREEWKKREEALHAALSEEDRAIMLAAKAGHDAIFESMREKLDAARSRVGEAMEAEPFDQSTLDAAIAAEGEVKAQLLREMTAARRSVMERLSPEGRKLLREMMPMRRGGDKGKRGADARGGKEPRPHHSGGPRPPHAPDAGRPAHAPAGLPSHAGNGHSGPIPGHPAPEALAEDMPNEQPIDQDEPGFAPAGHDIQPPDVPPLSAP